MQLHSIAVEPKQEDLLNWLKDQRGTHLMPVTVHTESTRLDGGYLSVAIHVGGKHDAVEKARLMQKIEDEWNYKVPNPAIKLLLVPTKD